MIELFARLYWKVFCKHDWTHWSDGKLRHWKCDKCPKRDHAPDPDQFAYPPSKDLIPRPKGNQHGSHRW